MNDYLALAEYNADVYTARRAYHADIAVQDGLCAACQWRRRDHAGRKRMCTTCRRAGVSLR